MPWVIKNIDDKKAFVDFNKECKEYGEGLVRTELDKLVNRCCEEIIDNLIAEFESMEALRDMNE